MPSHRRASLTVARPMLAAMYTIVIGTDDHGSFPMLLLDDGDLPGGAVDAWRRRRQ